MYVGCTDEYCLKCTPGNLTDCESCASVPGITYDADLRRCLCTKGQYRDGGTCRTCHALCSECTGPTSEECEAFKCRNKAYPMAIQPTTCVYMCVSPAGNLYTDYANALCKG